MDTIDAGRTAYSPKFMALTNRLIPERAHRSTIAEIGVVWRAAKGVTYTLGGDVGLAAREYAGKNIVECHD
jgi:hypothetical protein